MSTRWYGAVTTRARRDSRGTEQGPSAIPPSPPAHQSQYGRFATLWILPVVIMANLSRGMTIAPRIQVYTQIACDALHPPDSLPGHSNFTTSFPLIFPHIRSFIPLISPVLLDAQLPLHQKQTGVHVMAPSEECLHDPAVQSQAAGIQATLGTIVGILGIITAGHWGRTSDTSGRTKTLSANMLGMALHDVIYIVISIPNSMLQKKAWGVLMVGPIVEGLFGGLTTTYAAQNAYLADSSPSGSRSTIFAYYQGVGYISLALGPQLATILLRLVVSETTPSVFYLGFGLHVFCFLYSIIILPETVTYEMMQAARWPRGNAIIGEPNEPLEKWAHQMRQACRRLFTPLTMFGPHKQSNGKWDLNLTFLVVAQFAHLLSVGVVQVKYLYAQHIYAWSVEQLGNYISFLWALRAFHLLLLLPAIIHIVKPLPLPSFNASQIFSQNLQFDYRIAQFSIFIDTLAYVLTLIVPAASQMLFVSLTSLSCFTAGVNPAIHSLAVSFLHARHGSANVGQMFGGMSMLQAIAHTMQPVLFGLVYSQTVATFPKAIFALAAGLLLSSSVLLTLLRTNQTLRTGTERAARDEEPGEEVRSEIVLQGHDGSADDGGVLGERGLVESSTPLLSRDGECF